MTGPHDAPRALWLVPVAELGGVARHVLDVAGNGVPGWRITVLCPPGPLADRLRDAEVEVEAIAAPFGPEAGLRRSVRSLRQAVRRVRPSIVHSHLAYADVVAALAPLGASVARVSTEHGIARDGAVHHRHRLEAAAMAAAHTVRLRRADLLLAVSRSTVEEVRRSWHPPAGLRIRVVPNGMDRRDALPATPGLRVGALTRLAPEKGLDAVLDAVQLLRRSHPEATLQIAGDGPLRAHVARRAEHRDLAGAVELLGHVEPDALLRGIDVLVQLSDWENCSYSLLDAVARGVGVVATDVGGNAELLPTRCLVAPGDPAAAAACAADQGRHPDRRPGLPAGWPTVSDMCAAIGDAYDQLVGSP